MPLAMDIYIPSVPYLTEHLGTTSNGMQLTLSLFLLMYAVMQLIIGPMSDTYGRRGIAFWGVVIFIASSIIATFSQSLWFLLICRLFQAVGASIAYVVAFSMVRDEYSGGEAAKIYSYLNGMIAFSPLFGPAIGSYLEIKYGWESEFLFLAGLGVVAFVCLVFFLKETLPEERREVKQNSVWRDYLFIIKNKQFVLFSLIAGVAIGYLFTFFSLSPHILLVRLDVPIQKFGLYFAFMGISLLLGSSLGAYWVTRLGLRKTVLYGNVIAFLGGVLSVMWYLSAGQTIYSFVVPMLPIGIGGTVTLGACAAACLDPFAKLAGKATALLGFMQALVASLVGSTAVAIAPDSSMVLGVAAIVLSGFFGAVCFFAKSLPATKSNMNE